MPNLDLVLFDHEEWKQLFPLTLSRPVAELRVGISTIADKWSRVLDKPIYYHSADYLSQKYKPSSSREVLLINGAVPPSAELVAQIGNLKSGQVIMSDETVVATVTNNYRPDLAIGELLLSADIIQFNEAEVVQWPEDLLELNDVWINKDFEALEHIDHEVDLSNTLIIGPSGKISIGSNTTIHAYSMNTTDGPIHIGSNVLIMEGAMLRGPLSIGDGTVVKMGAKLYGKTTIGPNCKIGGEIKRVVIYANSNKGHDGYLGDSVVGEWCNFGADSNNSNMKNTYGLVNLYDISSQQKRRTSQQFLGLIMGDHCRCAINTQFNTGTIASYFANIFGPPPATFIRPFQWGQEEVFDIEKAVSVARIVYERRDIEFSQGDESIIRQLYNQFRK